MDTSPGHRIPKRELNIAQRIMASPIGEVLARRWLDWMILQTLKRLFFPFSRLWAAARAANGEVDKFAEAAPLTPNAHDTMPGDSPCRRPRPVGNGMPIAKASGAIVANGALLTGTPGPPGAPSR